ncbi:DUF2634 domain-containing protein [Lysinibacillus sphaericus]|uniref:DUF2634 domain-containing protein n=1 Tax=Lysinibacillus sphaericus TaxID=1421 RepID=UPI0021618AE7|nr:DUF2634 domain-containing protein [Lysinibacillus sphaericus]MCS1382718.1 DUF2634 domain-containing protein [Lysinibacillus sphaericus]
MIPQVENDGLTLDFEEVIEPSKNYKLLHDKNRCVGFIDELEAMKQAIFLMLSVERYDHIIYTWNAGFESKDLFGKPTAYVASEVPRRIQECLLQDDRINKVDSFVVTTKKNKVHVAYTAHTIFGELTLKKEVEY